MLSMKTASRDAGRVAEGQMENEDAERWLGIKCLWLFFAQRCKKCSFSCDEPETRKL